VTVPSLVILMRKAPPTRRSTCASTLPAGDIHSWRRSASVHQRNTSLTGAGRRRRISTPPDPLTSPLHEVLPRAGRGSAPRNADSSRATDLRRATATPAASGGVRARERRVVEGPRPPGPRCVLKPLPARSQTEPPNPSPWPSRDRPVAARPSAPGGRGRRIPRPTLRHDIQPFG